jgi:hypothetical protein
MKFLQTSDFSMPSTKILTTSLEYHGAYPCPVCHVGKISQMPMMEAMACDFCHQIFTVDIEKQQLQMPAREPALVWRWNGFDWTEAQLEGVELGWGYLCGAIAFILLPTVVIGIVAYSFPPTTGNLFSWIPYLWTCLTFLSHLSIIVWLLIEIYQIPIFAYIRAIVRLKDRFQRRRR